MLLQYLTNHTELKFSNFKESQRFFLVLLKYLFPFKQTLLIRFISSFFKVEI